MSNEIAVVSQLPAHIAAIVTKDGYRDQFGDMQSSDIKLNFLKITYGDSPQATKHGWGPTGQEQPLPIKTMFLSRSGQVIPVGTSFIPLYRSVRYISWEGRPGQGRMLFSTTDKNDTRIKEFMKDPQTGRWVNGLDFPKDAHGKTMAPPVTTYINIYVMLPICAWPCLLSFKRTSTPAGHQFSSDLFMATTTPQGRIPMHSLMFKLQEPKTIDDAGKPYYHFTWKAAGYTTDPAVFAKAAEMSQTAEAINSIASEQDLEGEDSEPAHETLKAATPATITVQAPPVQAQPVVQAAPAAPVAPVTPVVIPPMPQPTIAVPQATAPAVLVTPAAPAAPAPNVESPKALW